MLPERENERAKNQKLFWCVQSCIKSPRFHFLCKKKTKTKKFAFFLTIFTSLILTWPVLCQTFFSSPKIVIQTHKICYTHFVSGVQPHSLCRFICPNCGDKGFFVATFVSICRYVVYLSLQIHF
jgi:hypothetical protein